MRETYATSRREVASLVLCPMESRSLQLSRRLCSSATETCDDGYQGREDRRNGDDRHNHPLSHPLPRRRGRGRLGHKIVAAPFAEEPEGREPGERDVDGEHVVQPAFEFVLLLGV